MGAVSDGRRADSPHGTGEPATGVAAASRSAAARQVQRTPAALQQTVGNQGVLGRLAGSGHALDPGARQRMEGVLRHDFSRVRVHAGAEGAALAGRLNARAVTVGDDIAFAPGQYQPGTPVGDAILAHELAHVVQQRGTHEEPAAAPGIEPAHSPFEREAEGAAAGAVAALWAADRPGARFFAERARPTLRSQRRFQRCGYTVERPPHKFNSCGISASGAGPLAVANDTSPPSAFDQEGGVELASPTFRADGKVGISGGTDEQARDWVAGFISTVIRSRRRGTYSTDAGVHHHDLETLVSDPSRDAIIEASPLPWYATSDAEQFPGTDSTVATRIDDTPTSRRPWRHQGAQLVAFDGKDEFCSWLAVRQTSTREIVCLNWVTWEVDWAAKLDPVAKTGAGTGSGMTIVDSGDGQGALTPVTAGDTANKKINEQARKWFV